MISTHILDTSLGLPASDVAITLEKKRYRWQLGLDRKRNN